MPDQVSPSVPDVAPKRRGKPAGRRLVAILILVAVLAVLIWGVRIELESSPVQWRLFTRLTDGFNVSVEPGVNRTARFPKSGPFDNRLGYTGLPGFLNALQRAGYVVDRQARLSPDLDRFVELGGFAVYPEKSQAGLSIFERSNRTLYKAVHPERIFPDFDSTPPLVAATLSFIEDRDLFDLSFPTRNPAVEWDRLAAAGFNVAISTIFPTGRRFGGSTLATQLEKFRHSPGGRTTSPLEKLRQVVSASARAYLDGPDTTRARERILVDYVNSAPLSARAGFGEVIGLGDGLHVWYGTDLDEAARLLRQTPAAIAGSPGSAAVYKQVLSLMLALRRPSYYLLSGRNELSDLTDVYLGLLAEAGIIDAGLRDAARAQPLVFREKGPAPAASAPFVERKALNAIRAHLLSLLNIDSLYDLDRLDMRVETTLDMTVQRNMTEMLRRFGYPRYAREAGLYGKHLLRRDPSGVAYSVTLYERGEHANLVRVQADNIDQPLDLNEGGMFDLGSTAKLRTLATYLEIVAALHDRFASAPVTDLQGISDHSLDPLTRWAAHYLIRSKERSLAQMLEAAMERKYSGHPATFFTGRGQHSFANGHKSHNRTMSVRNAFPLSVNLVFIRMMRDIVKYYQAARSEPLGEVLKDAAHPARTRYLERFADMEGGVFLDRFYKRYRRLAPDDALALLASRVRPARHRLATAFRSVRPDASVVDFARFIQERLQGDALPEDTLHALYDKYGSDRFNLHDRGYIAGLHPLELWLVSYLQVHPEASRSEVMSAGAEERQEVYQWLFQSKRKASADRRIRIIAEQDAFAEVLESWKRQGYPFASLVPSLATAIGSSADRPAALAELIGIILNDGVRLPTVRIEHIHIAEDTPFEAHLSRPTDPGKRVFPPEITTVLRGSLEDVVAGGTAKRLSGVYTDANRKPIAVGGKTGTGDELIDRYGPGTTAGKGKEVSRSAAFTFFIGERFFGVVTAHVPGVNVQGHRFTSVLPTQVLKALEPVLAPLIRGEPSTPIPDDAQLAGEQRTGPSLVPISGSGSVKKRSVTRGSGPKPKRSAEARKRANKKRPPRVIDDLF